MKNYKDEPTKVRIEAAKQKNLSSEELLQLAKDPYNLVREALAQNPTISPEVFLLLAGDTSSWVLAYLTLNPSVSPEALAIIAKSKDPLLRYTVASHPLLPIAVLEMLAHDHEVFELQVGNDYTQASVSDGVYENPNLSREV